MEEIKKEKMDEYSSIGYRNDTEDRRKKRNGLDQIALAIKMAGMVTICLNQQRICIPSVFKRLPFNTQKTSERKAQYI